MRHTSVHNPTNWGRRLRSRCHENVGWLIGAVTAVCAVVSPASGQVNGSIPTTREIHASRTSQPPVIDGRLTEEAWSTAAGEAGFTQRDPDEGLPPTERTEVKVLYDDVALYVGVRLFDTQAPLIARRLSARDGDADADRLTIYLDPMHDHLTGAIFRVSASNVQQDAILYNDTWWDNTWDGVWQSQVSVDEGGWSAELRIPLSQLRFPTAAEQTWGFNVERYIRRKNENAWLEMVPKKESGTASRMLHLTGLDGIQPKRRLELMPYMASRAEFIAPGGAATNPFNDGSRVFGSAGLDVKWGLTSNLTVTATMNPDFGQVEVDPAVVNLTAFETYFQEKRPFFLEGSTIINNFGRTGSNDFWGFNNSEPQLFYSRRIGRSPQLTASGDFVDPPTATTILGAAKLTGKTSRGWSIGLLEAITSDERARTSTGLALSRSVIEPLSNYAVVRVQRELGTRAGVGLLTTAVNRRLDTQPLRDGLTDSALVMGADGHFFLDGNREWVMTGNLAASRVTGSAAVIERLQRAPQRYLQRPDAVHVRLDPARTSLSGITGRLNLNRNSGLKRVNVSLWGVSPGFESNDLGFHNTGDRGGAHGVFLWQHVTPGRVTRRRSLWVAKWWTWNNRRDLQGDGVNAQAQITLLNYWFLNVNAGARRGVQDDRLTRGGPSAAAPAGGFWNFYGSTDSRAWFSISGNVNRGWSEGAGGNHNASLSFNVKPSSMLTISTGPQWNTSDVVAQYVSAVEDATAAGTLGGRYVFGRLDQKQLTMTTRVNVILTPTVSLQVFMQPLLAAGDYSGFKELARPRTFDFVAYGAFDRPLTYDAAARKYTVDPDGASGDAVPFTFDDPDYSLKSLRVNAVFRWEMKPGSALYAVWTRQQQDKSNPGLFAPGRDARTLFSAAGDDVLLFKMSYWLGR